MSKKNQTLPVKLITSGSAYAGLLSRSITVNIPFSILFFNQLLDGFSSEGWGEGWKLSAARRMNGVVRPHAMPTRRKPRVQRIMEGDGTSGVEVSGEEAIAGSNEGLEEGEN